MVEKLNYFLYINSIRIISLFGYNRFTYQIFSFFYGLGYKYSFGCIRLEPSIASDKISSLNAGEPFLYIEFMPWSFGNYVQTKDKLIRKKIMLHGIEDFLSMTRFFQKNKTKLPKKIISYSNKRIAILIHKKLGFEFIDFEDYQDVIENCKGDVVRLETTIEKIIEQKKSNEKILIRLKFLNSR
jgi:hypothetical protein